LIEQKEGNRFYYLGMKMKKIGMIKKKEFMHPSVDDESPLKEHVLYCLKPKQQSTVIKRVSSNLHF